MYSEKEHKFIDSNFPRLIVHKRYISGFRASKVKNNNKIKIY